MPFATHGMHQAPRRGVEDILQDLGKLTQDKAAPHHQQEVEQNIKQTQKFLEDSSQLTLTTPSEIKGMKVSIKEPEDFEPTAAALKDPTTKDLKTLKPQSLTINLDTDTDPQTSQTEFDVRAKSGAKAAGNA